MILKFKSCRVLYYNPISCNIDHFLIKSHKCYLHSDTKIMTIDFVIVAFLFFFLKFTFFKKGLKGGKGSQNGTSFICGVHSATCSCGVSIFRALCIEELGQFCGEHKTFSLCEISSNNHFITKNLSCYQCCCLPVWLFPGQLSKHKSPRLEVGAKRKWTRIFPKYKPILGIGRSRT